MKLSIALMIFVSVISTLAAEPVSVSTARQAAEGRVARDGHTGTHTISAVIPVENAASQPLAYLFELSPTGYVVTSADGDLPPVIAYSYENGCAVDESGSNPLLEMVITDMGLRLSVIDQAPEGLIRLHRAMWDEYLSGRLGVSSPALFEQWPPEGSTPTGGWLMENWHQGAPFNQYCPMDLIAGARSVAGCPAVAMGMIVNLGETTNGTRFDDDDDYYHNYHEYYWIDDDFVAHDFPSWTELNGYMDIIDSHYAAQTPLADSDKAALVYACGAACRQVYTASVSGTFGVDQAYEAYLRFDFDECLLMYASSDSLYEKLSQNMMDAMPAHLAIVDAGPTYGHNVVLDGYNTDEFYHINFGWNGPYNGWYQFPLTEMPYEMNIIEGIILDIGDGQLSADEGAAGGLPMISLAPGSNPAATPVQLRMTLSQESQVTIRVYDISGHLVDTVAGAAFSAGTHDLAWNASNASSGVYFLVASGPWGASTLRFTLLP